jgi:hypothetical protein
MISREDRELLRQIRVDRFIDEATEEYKQTEIGRSELPPNNNATTAATTQAQKKIRRSTPTTLPANADYRRRNDSGLGGLVLFIIVCGFLWFCGVTIYKLFAYSDVEGAVNKVSSVVQCALSPTCTQVPSSRQ